ncbi:MAG: TldD/PmbA family protein [Pseudomonadota bacterium]
MPQDLSSLTRALLECAGRAGADAADAMALEATSLSVDVRGGALEHVERAEGIDIGLRVLSGHRQACVSASDTSPETLANMAERAVAMAREAPKDPSVGLAEPDQLAACWDVAVLELEDPASDPSPADLQTDAAAAETAALSQTGVSQVEGSSAAFARRHMHLATSNGFSGGYARTEHSLYCVAITGEGTSMERDYAGEARSHRSDLPPPEEIGLLAAERALARIGARKPRTGAFPVLFDERVAASLIGHLLAAMNGRMVARGSSWLRDAMGTRILPEGLSIVEDPHRPRISGSRPFDAEGLPTARRHLVSDGILQSWILDLATGRRLNLPSTANASRGTSAPPAPGVGNVALTQGRKTREMLLADLGTGLWVTSLIGASVNPTTGDYSRGASGFWVENGEIAHSVNECTLAGNLRDMLRTIVPANDARSHVSRVVPSLLVEGLTLAGE